MKTEKQLKQLMGIRTGLKDSTGKMQAYFNYIEKTSFSLEVHIKAKYFQEWYSALSNSIGAILSSKDCFIESKEKLSIFEQLVKGNVPIPKRLERYFSENDDLSYERVLRIARNRPQHPEKTNQEEYVYLADSISVESLGCIQNAAIELFDAEIQTLSQTERNTMIRDSIELKRDIYAVQEELRPFLDCLQRMEGVTPEQIKVLEDFFQYAPTAENVVFYDPVDGVDAYMSENSARKDEKENGV